MDGAVDTTGPDGRTVIELFTALQRFVRDAHVDAARDGGVAADRSGEKRRGRPPRVTPDQISQARQMLRDPGETVASVARRFGVSRSTLYWHHPELTGRPSRRVPR
jgi:DNA invertase Pin-like site-specific DNA recombinase